MAAVQERMADLQPRRKADIVAGPHDMTGTAVEQQGDLPFQDQRLLLLQHVVMARRHALPGMRGFDHHADAIILADGLLGEMLAATVEARRPVLVEPVDIGGADRRLRLDRGGGLGLVECGFAGRALARLKFAGLPKHLSGEELAAYWGAVEIPYRPYYAYEETLATVGDAAGLANSLLSAFERLTTVISDGEVTALPAVPERVRLRCRDAYIRRQPSAASAEITLAYVAENRMWADWTESVLRAVGCHVTPRDLSVSPLDPVPDPARTVVLLSSAFLKSRTAEAAWRALSTAEGAVGRGRMVALRVDDVRLPGTYLGRSPVDLHRLDEKDCMAAVLRALDLPVQPPERDGTDSRFPGTVPQIWNAPPRNAAFTGRNQVLEKMRDQLGSGMSALLQQPQALFGLAQHPTVGGGRVPLTLLLTSPAGRLIQATKDLPGFWNGSWASVAKEMRGRYPRHPWPDDPAAADPTLRTKKAMQRS